MESKKVGFTSIDEYITTFPKEIQIKMEQLRVTIKAAAPEAEEIISYQIPTFYLKGNLVHFAVYKKHIGFYPTPSAIKQFQKELSQYELGKGTIKFPISKTIPFDLIKRIVKFRVKENLEKSIS